MKRRKVTTFSLSFLDCICCGLGAIILLFVLVNAKSAAHRDTLVSELRDEVERLESRVIDGKKDLVEARNALNQTLEAQVKTEGLSRKILSLLAEKRIELADRENETLASKEHIDKLKTDLKSLEPELKRLKAGAETQDDLGTRLRSFPGQGDRQYLTDLKMGGMRIFILVDASASMLDETIVGVIRRKNQSNPNKLKSWKWRQAVSTVDWLTSQLPTKSSYQIYVFNENTRPVIEGTGGTWLKANNIAVLNRAVDQMKKVVPENGTSLMNAFKAMSEITPAPDNIFLLTDGLPTMGSKKPWSKRVSPKKRLSLFDDAITRLPSMVPINIILYPMEGDPQAASAYWRLAKDTRGSFFCPSRDWP
jgi:hypothetical protein